MALPGYDENRTQFPGIHRTSAGLGGNIPQQTITGYETYIEKPLYKSPREVALLLDKTFRAGYGCLPKGTVLAEDQNTNKLVPYVPDSIDKDNDFARVFLTNDCNAADNFDVDLVESYKLDEGDSILIMDSNTSAESGEISTIDRSSSKYTATITLTGATSGNFTVAKNANCYVKSEDADSGKRSKAVYILDMEVDTGAGRDAKGGLGSVLLSNAVLYKNAVTGMDSQAMTDLGNVSEDDAGYYIVK